MAKEIKQKIVLEGEKEYNAAIKEASRNLRTLRSELKAETAEMGRNASQSEKSEVKAKNLKKQIAEQEKIVKAYKQTLQEVREKYADNEDAIASWEQKLNNARATLGNMKNELEDVGGTFRRLETDSASAVTATKSVADAIGRISQVGESVAGSIEGIFTGILGAISSTVNEIWGMIAETSARANQYTDIAGYWNTDPQKIQQWARAVAASKNEFTDMANAVSKIAYGDHDKIYDITGVSWSGDIDQWQYAVDVLSSIASMDYTRKIAALEDLFGEKRASKVMGILNDWQKINELVPKFNGDESGYGMTSEELATMDDVAVKIATIEQSWIALKDKIAAGFGTLTMPLLLDVQGAMDGVADFLTAENEEEREAALEKIRTNLEDFFTRLGQIVTECIGILNDIGQELQTSDDPITKAIGDILVGLTDALQWMIDNQEAVKTAFEAIFGMWLIAKLASVAGKLSGIVANIETIKAFKNWKMPTDGTDGTGTGTGTGTGGGNGNTGTENVTTQNVTTQNLTTANITSGNTTTENVQTMYVANMVGGNGNNPTTPTTSPSGGGNGGSPILLPPGGGNDYLNGGYNGLPDGGSNLTGGGNSGPALLPPGDVNIDTGGGDVNIGNPGGDPITLSPDEFNIDNGPQVPPAGPEVEPTGYELTGAAGLAAAFQELTGMTFTGFMGGAGISAALVYALTQWAASGNQTIDYYPDPHGYDHRDDAERLQIAIRGVLGTEGYRYGESSSAFAMRYLAQHMDDPQDFFSIFDYNDGEGQRNWFVDIAGNKDYKRTAAALYYMWKSRFGNDTTAMNGLTPEQRNALTWAMEDYTALDQSGQMEYASPLANIRRFFSTKGLFDEEGNFWIPSVYEKEQERKQQEEEANTTGRMVDAIETLTGRLMNGDWLNADRWNGGSGSQQEGITSGDLANFNSLPAQLQKAAQAGTAAGVSGIRVYMDGASVGRLVAPYVSQIIAREIG